MLFGYEDKKNVKGGGGGVGKTLGKDLIRVQGHNLGSRYTANRYWFITAGKLTLFSLLHLLADSLALLLMPQSHLSGLLLSFLNIRTRN